MKTNKWIKRTNNTLPATYIIVEVEVSTQQIVNQWKHVAHANWRGNDDKSLIGTKFNRAGYKHMPAPEETLTDFTPEFW